MKEDTGDSKGEQENMRETRSMRKRRRGAR
jgi:hypothetical protein